MPMEVESIEDAATTLSSPELTYVLTKEEGDSPRPGTSGEGASCLPPSQLSCGDKAEGREGAGTE